jgi:hypothetical protein
MSPIPKRRAFLLAVLAASAPLAYAQDPLSESRINALTGLPSVGLVLRLNTPVEVFSMKEWSNIVEILVRQNVPDLQLVAAEESPNWLELSIVSSERGGAIELAVHRWAKVSATGQEVVAKVWSESRFVFGSVSKSSMRESLDSLVLSLAADYSRAKRR